MHGKLYTTRVCMLGKCGSCIHAHYTRKNYPYAIECDLMNPTNIMFQRTMGACAMYAFDSTKVCKCSETKEDWYNFCPTCGAFIGERKDKIKEENIMYETCGDNRFEIIQKAKADLRQSTNINGSPDEMKVLDSFLFRAWQMGWLDKYGDCHD